MIYFENKTSENYMRRAAGIQECPKCQVFCMRRNSKDRRIVCLSCKKDGKTYEFCWYCLGDWNSPGTSNCGNDACTGEDPRLKILKEARLKEVVGVEGCPSIRACPKCGLLIEHTEACKHMVCVCGQKFCFICLTKPRADGNYRCGAYNNPCKIAPIQEKIGNMDEDNEDTSVVTGDETADDNTERTSLTLNIDSDLESSEDETEVFLQTEIDIWYERWYAAPIQKKIANTTDEGTERTSLTLNTDSDLGLFADETGYSGDIEIDRLNAQKKMQIMRCRILLAYQPKGIQREVMKVSRMFLKMSIVSFSKCIQH
ncbi:uncharacterized protein [Argopecten irradians]|uniref:uncharacterized protein n=1 Tax=Argopecten irradians TaxID=31199 RepID=UPI0037108A2A